MNDSFNLNLVSATDTLSLTLLTLNSQCVDVAKDHSEIVKIEVITFIRSNSKDF